MRAVAAFLTLALGCRAGYPTESDGAPAENDGAPAENDGAPVSAGCGDGVVRAHVELCDDGNTEDDDDCTNECVPRPCDLPANKVVAERGRCYSFHDTPMSFFGADALCASLGAHLATIDSEKENELVGSVVGPSDAWIGLINRDDDFSWLTGEALAYANWSHSPVADDHVGFFDGAEGTWMPVDLDVHTSAHPVVCEQSAASWRIDPGTGHAYRVFLEQRTFDAAQSACQELGGHLATLTEASEQNTVESLVFLQAWIGLRDQGEGYEWITGEDSDGFNNWLGEMTPDACARIQDNNYWWSSVDCKSTLIYICELD